MKRLDLGLFDGPATAAPGDTLLVLVPEDERPLGGDAGRVDWRLCGELSHLLATHYISGQLGEAALLPADGRLHVSRLILFGLGPSVQLPGRNLSLAIRSAVEKVLGLRTENAALAFPDAIDFEADAEVLLLAAARTLGETPGAGFLRLVLPEAARRERALERAFGEVCAHARARGVELTAHHVEAERPAARSPRPPARPFAPEPTAQA